MYLKDLLRNVMRALILQNLYTQNLLRNVMKPLILQNLHKIYQRIYFELLIFQNLHKIYQGMQEKSCSLISGRLASLLNIGTGTL